ncbi:MAG: hypothetical protein OXH23_02745 [bacterium]|nr:hypothetical protein [bacterium]
MNDLGDPAGYKLAYEAGLKTLEEQANSLREIRDRSGALLSVALLTGGLVAGLATLGSGSPSLKGAGYFGGVMVGVAVIGIAILTILAWRPPKGSASLDAAQIIGSYVEGDPALQQAELHRELALHLSENSHTNSEELGMTRLLFRLGLGMMILEVSGVAMMLWEIANE